MFQPLISGHLYFHHPQKRSTVFAELPGSQGFCLERRKTKMKWLESGLFFVTTGGNFFCWLKTSGPAVELHCMDPPQRCFLINTEAEFL